MRADGLGEFSNINDYIRNKIDAFERDKSFNTLFEMMFSESDNIMYEYSAGYKIVKVTYRQAKNEALCLAGGLKKALDKYAPDSVIGLYGENSLKWIELLWAILLCGHRPLLLNLRLSDELLQDAISQSGACAVISDGKQFNIDTYLFNDAIAGEAIASPVFGTELLVMSSGTSQSVKLCAYSSEEFYYQLCGSFSIVRQCTQIREHYEGKLKLLAFLPFYHIFGLAAVYVWFTFFSRTLVQLNNLAPMTILNTVKRHKVTHIFAVPLFWETVYGKAVEAIRDKGDKTYQKYLKGMALGKKLFGVPLLGKAYSHFAFREIRENLFNNSIRFMISGGSNISSEALDFFNIIGYRLANGFGMTEVGITSVELSPKKAYLLGGFVGSPMDNCEYKIDENGMLLIKGAATSRYIIENGVRVPNDSWYKTGDLAECVNGHYKILSRADDVIITSNGENLNPNFAEHNFLIENAEDACLTKIIENGKTVPLLVISVKRLDEESFETLNAQIREIAKKIKFPADGKIFYTNEALMAANEFKLNRRRIASDVALGRLKVFDAFSKVDTAAVDDELYRGIIEAAKRALSVEGIGGDDDFFMDLNVTSLDYLAFIAELNEEFGVELEVGREDLRTVLQIYKYISESKNGGL